MAPRRFSLVCNQAWKPQKTTKSYEGISKYAGTCNHSSMEMSNVRGLARRGSGGVAGGAYGVDSYTGESCSSNSFTILGILGGSHQAMMVCLEQRTDDRENNDAKDGDDDAVSPNV